MSKPDLLTRLAQHRALGSAPVAEHKWLAERGAVQKFAAGEVLVPKGELVQWLFIILEGRIVICVDRGTGTHKVADWRTGDATGHLPYSRGGPTPGDAVAEEPTEVLALAAEELPALTRDCPVITTALVHAMLDRTRLFTSSDLRDEKLISLGKLAAGLAHELNNPASAALSNAKALTEAIAGVEETSRRLGAENLSDAQLSAIEALRDVCRPEATAARSAVARADREDALAEWLAAHNVSDWCVEALAETTLELNDLDALAARIGDEALAPALQWIAAGSQVRSLTAHIERSATRVYELVNAVKGFTFMDRAPTLQPVDVRPGITETFAMLGAKTRGKTVDVSVEIPDNLPQVLGMGAELNQVWMNLIDNAIDAVSVGGHVQVVASQTRRGVNVEVVDDGAGIPAAILGRIFDPFFTTKGVGQGTGLGLDIVRRIVKQHEGEIEVESRPGRTVFRVTLPAVMRSADPSPSARDDRGVTARDDKGVMARDDKGVTARDYNK
jgi:signal transduction histidine kinase